MAVYASNGNLADALEVAYTEKDKYGYLAIDMHRWAYILSDKRELVENYANDFFYDDYIFFDINGLETKEDFVEFYNRDWM